MKESNNISNIVKKSEIEEIYPSFSLENLFDKIRILSKKTQDITKDSKDNQLINNSSNNILNPEHNLNEVQFEFLSFMSHQFKTPISIIKACVDVLKKVGGYSEEDKMLFQQLYKIDRSISRMNELIETTLELSKLEDGKLDLKKEEFSLHNLFNILLKRYSDLNPEVKFDLNVEFKGCLFIGDQMLIEQVFSNLISNAIKYSPNNPKISIEGIIKNQEFIISIIDNGIGISELDIKKLFNKFFRSKNSNDIGGTGIGLYLAKQLISLHDGKISVISKLNQGSKFTVNLPIMN